jgi:alpha-glucuronidase
MPRADWNPYYYHRATREAVGFDRSSSGSNAVAQYATPVAAQFEAIGSTPENLLLWFHRLSWDHKLASGDTLWEAMIEQYDRGVSDVERMQSTWAGLSGFVDADRFKKVSDYLAIQLREARWWRDACIAYFQSVNGLPLPESVRPPAESLDYYRELEFPYAPGN